MLALDKVNVFYGAIHALRDVSLTVNTGEVVTLIGANGAGKSTTLRAITGLLTPRCGSMRFEDQDVTGCAAAQARAPRHLDGPGRPRRLRESHRTRESRNGRVPDERQACRFRRDLERGFTLFPRLKERMKQRAGTLSGGEQQMLSIARALMSHPKLLLLDEPSLGLAPLICHTIFSTIDEIKAEGTTVLLVEQNANAALKHSDRGYVLETGAVILEGSAAEIAGNPRVREAYLGE